MRTIAATFLILLISAHCNAGSIEFKYIGDQDKPVPSLIITDDANYPADTTLFAPFVHIVKVSPTTSFYIGTLVHKTSTKQALPVAFQISINENSKSTVVSSLNQDGAVKYLECLEGAISENKSLKKDEQVSITNALDNIIKRMGGKEK